MMRVLNIHGPGDVRLDSTTPPEVGPNDALVRIEACGICGSDLKYIRHGGTPARKATDEAPMPLGHEAAGVVIKTGAALEGIEPGMRVIVNPMTADSVIGNGGDQGAFADTLLVRGARCGATLYTMPEGVDFEIAALAEPLAVSLHGVNRGQVKPGDKAVVFGAGPIGLGMVLWLKARGLTDVISVDISPYRLQLARLLGATATILSGQENVRKCLADLHGSKRTRYGHLVGTDVYFDAAGAPSVMPDILAMGKEDARLVITAIQDEPVPIDLSRALAKEMHITSARGYPTEFPEVIAMLTEHGEAARKLISHRLAFKDILAGLDIASSLNSGKVMITFPPG
jgi:(R,R)-butanediol dehydrogenase/meso-butanediol dehydrogenase/diacetyl reductase